MQYVDLMRLILKTRSCSRGGSPHPSLSSKCAEKQPGGILRHFSQSGGKTSSLSQSVGRPSSGLSTEVSKSHGRASSRHSSHGAGRPSSQMSSRLSVSRFLHIVHGAKPSSHWTGIQCLSPQTGQFYPVCCQIVPRVALSLITV